MTDGERVEIVKQIFSTVTGKYDILNRFLSLRRDVAWRDFCVGKMRLFETYRVLDVATGTADLAIAAVRHYPNCRAVGVDFVREMIGVGLQKVRTRHLGGSVEVLCGDALCLPFPDCCFDVAAIAFGIRNIPDKIAALKEMTRAVAPGGQVMVLELTFPQNRLIRQVYDVYLNRLLPRIASIFSLNPAAYRYLGDSIVNFPSPEGLVGLMEDAGLEGVKKYSLTLGITHLHVGVRPPAEG